MMLLTILSYTMLSQPIVRPTCVWPLEQERDLRRQTDLTVKATQLDVAELRSYIEHDRVAFETYRSNVSNTLSCGIAVLIGIAASFWLKQKIQLQELFKRMNGHERELSLWNERFLIEDAAKAKRERERERSREAAELAAWVASHCYSHGTCCLPKGHATPGAAVVEHVSRDGHKFSTRNGQWGHEGHERHFPRRPPPLSMEVD